MSIETLWNEPRCVNEGFFISSRNGKVLKYNIEDGSFILPPYSDNFYEDMVKFILEHYENVKDVEYIKDMVDVTDENIISRFMD